MMDPWIFLPCWHTLGFVPQVAMNLATGNTWCSSDGVLVLEWVLETDVPEWKAAFAVGVFLRGGAR